MSKEEQIILEIKNRIAGENGIASWYDINVYNRANFVNDVAIRYAEKQLSDYKEKLKRALIVANNGSKHPMVNQQLFIDLIDSL